MEATVAFQRQREAILRIFLSEHKWFGGQPTEEEAIMMQFQGDDSGIPIPAVFMFVPGMPIVVNKALGKEHLSTLSTMNHLALMLKHLGKYEKTN